jgi:hypothetical protein
MGNRTADAERRRTSGAATSAPASSVARHPPSPLRYSANPGCYCRPDGSNGRAHEHRGKCRSDSTRQRVRQLCRAYRICARGSAQERVANRPGFRPADYVRRKIIRDAIRGRDFGQRCYKAPSRRPPRSGDQPVHSRPRAKSDHTFIRPAHDIPVTRRCRRIAIAARCDDDRILLLAGRSGCPGAGAGRDYCGFRRFHH